VNSARRYGRDDFDPTDDARQLCGEIAAKPRPVRRRSGLLRLLGTHWRDEAVAAARDVGDEAIAAPAIAQRLAQRGDMDPQRPVVDDGIGPSAGDQLIPSDGLASAFDKCDEDIEGPCAEAQRLPVFEQLALRRDQAERSEGEGFFIHREIAPKGQPIPTAGGKFSQTREQRPNQAFGCAVFSVFANGCFRLLKTTAKVALHNFTTINAALA